MNLRKILSTWSALCSLAVGAGGLPGCGELAAPLEEHRMPLTAPIVDLPTKGEQSPAAGTLAQGTVYLGDAGGPLTSRPYKFKVPSRYDATKATPLLVMLHGFMASADLNELIVKLAPMAEAKTMLYATPDGTQNPLGIRFWNATDFCCNFFGSTVDDVAYLTAIIDDMAKRFNVDKKRVFIVGHSNGGFMANRMACDRASKIAAIVSLAGAQWNDATRCLPTEKVSVLQVHGNLDGIIGFGGALGYPSAKETVAIWANRNGCTGRLTYGGKRLDLEGVLLGAETKVEEYTGCAANGSVALWTMEGAGHVPLFNNHWADSVYEFLMAHPKP